MASQAPPAPRLPDCVGLHLALVVCVAPEERVLAALTAWAPELRLGLDAFAPPSADGAAALSSRSYRFEGKGASSLDAETAAAAGALAPRLGLQQVQAALLLRRAYPDATAAQLRALPGDAAALAQAARHCTRRLFRERRALLALFKDVVLLAAAAEEEDVDGARPRYRYAAVAAEALQQMQARAARRLRFHALLETLN